MKVDFRHCCLEYAPLPCLINSHNRYGQEALTSLSFLVAADLVLTWSDKQRLYGICAFCYCRHSKDAC